MELRTTRTLTRARPWISLPRKKQDTISPFNNNKYLAESNGNEEKHQQQDFYWIQHQIFGTNIKEMHSRQQGGLL